jgi:glycosyltransferase involved in cell wall biosynthesis
MLGVFLGGYLERWWKPVCTWNEIVTLLVKPDLLIITNDGTRGDRVAERFGVPPENFWFPVNGVDSAVVPLPGDRERMRTRIGAADDDAVVISVGRLVAWKRMDRVITAFARAARNAGGTPRLLLAGDGPEQRPLEDHARQMGVADRVHFLGNVSRSLLRESLAAADVATFAYEHSNVGSSLLEAMRAGKAILSIANGDTPLFVEHEVSGLLARPSSVDDDLALFMRRLFDDAALRNRLAGGAATWAEANLPSWSERMDRECDKLERLCSGWRPVVSRAA